MFCVQNKLVIEFKSNKSESLCLANDYSECGTVSEKMISPDDNLYDEKKFSFCFLCHTIQLKLIYSIVFGASAQKQTSIKTIYIFRYSSPFFGHFMSHKFLLILFPLSVSSGDMYIFSTFPRINRKAKTEMRSTMARWCIYIYSNYSLIAHTFCVYYACGCLFVCFTVASSLLFLDLAFFAFA